MNVHFDKEKGIFKKITSSLPAWNFLVVVCVCVRIFHQNIYMHAENENQQVCPSKQVSRIKFLSYLTATSGRFSIWSSSCGLLCRYHVGDEFSRIETAIVRHGRSSQPGCTLPIEFIVDAMSFVPNGEPVGKLMRASFLTFFLVLENEWVKHPPQKKEERNKGKNTLTHV